MDKGPELPDESLMIDWYNRETTFVNTFWLTGHQSQSEKGTALKE